MGSQREDSAATDQDASAERDAPADRDAPTDPDDSPPRGVPTDRVHVRRLDVVDTLRWSKEVLTDSLELVGLAFAVSLLSVVALAGVSLTAPAEPPRVADWVWPVYLALFVGFALAWSVVYATADAAVEERAPSLADRLKQSVARLPALVVTGILAWLLTAVGLFLLVLPGVYLFCRLVLAYPACVIDRKGPLGSLRAGWRASRGNVTKVFGVSFGYVALSAASNYAASAFGPLSLAGEFVSAGLTAGLLPLFGLAFGHLYLESSRNQ